MGLERFLESQKSDTKTKSPDCETCSLVVKFDTLDQFVKGVHSEEIKGRLRALARKVCSVVRSARGKESPLSTAQSATVAFLLPL